MQTCTSRGKRSRPLFVFFDADHRASMRRCHHACRLYQLLEAWRHPRGQGQLGRGPAVAPVTSDGRQDPCALSDGRLHATGACQAGRAHPPGSPGRRARSSESQGPRHLKEGSSEQVHCGPRTEWMETHRSLPHYGREGRTSSIPGMEPSMDQRSSQPAPGWLVDGRLGSTFLPGERQGRATRP